MVNIKRADQNLQDKGQRRHIYFMAESIFNLIPANTVCLFVPRAEVDRVLE